VSLLTLAIGLVTCPEARLELVPQVSRSLDLDDVGGTRIPFCVLDCDPRSLNQSNERSHD